MSSSSQNSSTLTFGEEPGKRRGLRFNPTFTILRKKTLTGFDTVPYRRVRIVNDIVYLYFDFGEVAPRRSQLPEVFDGFLIVPDAR